MFGLSHQTQAPLPLRSSDGSKLLTDKNDILSCSSEHFGSLFGDKLSVQEALILNIPQQQVKTELENPPDKEEIEIAVSKLKTHKAPGVDCILAEVL